MSYEKVWEGPFVSPTFGMTTTKFYKSVFLWHYSVRMFPLFQRNYLSSLGGSSDAGIVRKMMRTLGTNGLWSHYSLKGNKGKLKLEDTSIPRVIIRKCLTILLSMIKLCHTKTGLKIFVFVILKEGLAGIDYGIILCCLCRLHFIIHVIPKEGLADWDPFGMTWIIKCNLQRQQSMIP